jgi:hypothetical protein
VFISVSVPTDDDRGPPYTVQALAAIHHANGRRLPIALLFGRYRRAKTLLCRFPPELVAVVENQLAAHYRS